MKNLTLLSACTIPLLLVAACGGSSSTGGLASSQVLKFPVYQSPGTWDPGTADAEVDQEIQQNGNAGGAPAAFCTSR